MVSVAGRSWISSALYFSPLAWKKAMASSRSITSRANGAPRAMISRIFASMAAKSSGVNGSLRAKS